MTVHSWTATSNDPRLDAEAFGTQFRPQLHNAWTEYETFFGAIGVASAVALDIAADCLAAIHEWAPDLAEEIRLIADGAGLSNAQVTALNARTEIMATVPPAGNGECSTGIYLPPEGGTPRSIQTWDWLDALSNDTVVRSFARADIGVTTFSEFGQLAKIGVNSAGVGVHFNILNHVSDGGRPGVPVHIVARRILDSASSLEEAIAIARSARVSASTVITVITRHGEAACIELCPDGVAVIRAVPGTALVHTNHFLDPTLAQGETTPHFISTYNRFTCLTERRDAISEPDPLARVQRLAGTDEGGPINVTPRLDAPFELSWATKATITLDVQNTTMGLCEGGPSLTSAERWRIFPEHR